jgi:solute:Na+ symporter, SSS family
MSQFLVFLLVYIGLQFTVVFFLSKRIKNEKDYLVGGQQIPTFLLMFSLFATWFGAETCIGTSGEVYEKGISGGRADPFGYSLCLFFLGLVIAKKIWNSNYATLSDFYRHRFGEKTEKLASILLLVSSILWGAAQFRALSQVISSSTQLPLMFTFGIAFIFVVSYSTLGGLLGDIYNDFVQGIILITGLCVLCFTIFKMEGFSILADQTAQRLSLLSTDESGWQRLDRWAIPILGSLIAQESISRLLAARNPQTAQRSAFYSSILYFFVGAIPVILGLVGPTVLPGITDKEHFLTMLSQKYLTLPLQYLLVGALVAAILSTVDSILLSGGGVLSHNIILPMLKITDEKLKLKLNRLGVLIIALIALIIAWFSEGIYQLVESASSLGTAGLLIITLFGLWSKKGHALAAIATLIVGLVTHPVADRWINAEAPFLFTVTLCLVTYITISFWKKESSLAT